MNKKVIVRFVWDLLMILFFLGFVFALLWYTNGSLETMPTEEQQEKAQVAAIFSMIMTGVPCMLCTAVRGRRK